MRRRSLQCRWRPVVRRQINTKVLGQNMPITRYFHSYNSQRHLILMLHLQILLASQSFRKSREYRAVLHNLQLKRIRRYFQPCTTSAILRESMFAGLQRALRPLPRSRSAQTHTFRTMDGRATNLRDTQGHQSLSSTVPI